MVLFPCFLLLIHSVVCSSELILHSCCKLIETTGHQSVGFPGCDITHPNASLELWTDRTVKHKPINCPEHFELSSDEFKVDDDGVLHIAVPNDECFNGRLPDTLHNPGTYCLDYDISSNMMHDISSNLIARVCSEATESIEDAVIPLELKISVAVSASLLFITVAIYSFKSSIRWSNSAFVIAQSIALCLAFFILAGLQNTQTLSNCNVCVTAGYSLQYFFLASFFWMNAHCFHLYLTIVHCRPQRGSLDLDNMRRKKFIRASAYAWGVPFIICLATYIQQAYYYMDDPRYRPDIGHVSCFFQRWEVKWIYFYGPLSAIIIVNAVLFVLTFLSLFKHQLLTKNLRQANRSRYQREIWFSVQYLKLFLVTGLSWTAEMIGFAYKTHYNSEDKLEYIWRATDFFNCLQGVFMFILFVWDKRVIGCFKKPFLKEIMLCSCYKDSIDANISMTTNTSVH